MLYLLNTFKSPDLMCVWNDGASADTSQLYLPEALISNLCKIIWLAFDDSFCEMKMKILLSFSFFSWFNVITTTIATTNSNPILYRNEFDLIWIKLFSCGLGWVLFVHTIGEEYRNGCDTFRWRSDECLGILKIDLILFHLICDARMWLTDQPDMATMMMMILMRDCSRQSWFNIGVSHSLLTVLVSVTKLTLMSIIKNRYSTVFGS